MISADILYSLLILIVIVLGLSYVGRFFEKMSPKALKALDYGSFALACVSGGLLYFGKGGTAGRVVFLVSMVVYFITLRHSMHSSPQASD